MADQSVVARPHKISRTSNLQRPVDSALFCFLLCVPGLALFGWLFWPRIVSSEMVDDFTGFLIGAKLLGTGHLYEVAANLAFQKSLTGRVDPAIIVVQVPVWAWAMKPFL